jgi:hypothetical protein
MTNPEVRTFHLGDLLSVTTGVLVSPRYMDGLSDIVGYLTWADLDVDHIPESLQACRGYVLRQVPVLAEVTADDLSFESWRGWLDEQVKMFGEWHSVQRPSPGEVKLPA